MKVSLFITCFNDALFPETGQAVVRLLERLGCEVEFRAAQTCCGQMHHNAGYQPEAVDLVRRFTDVFQDADMIVAPSTSCTAMIRHQYPRLARFARDAALERDVAAITPKVFELSECPGAAFGCFSRAKGSITTQKNQRPPLRGDLGE